MLILFTISTGTENIYVLRIAISSILPSFFSISKTMFDDMRPHSFLFYLLPTKLTRYGHDMLNTILPNLGKDIAFSFGASAGTLLAVNHFYIGTEFHQPSHPSKSKLLLAPSSLEQL